MLSAKTIAISAPAFALFPVTGMVSTRSAARSASPPTPPTPGKRPRLESPLPLTSPSPATTKRASPKLQPPPCAQSGDLEDAPPALPPSPERARRALALLRAHFRPAADALQKEERPASKAQTPVLDSLIRTILSQATTNANSARAYRELRARFPTWRAALRAGPDGIADAARVAGLASQKGATIARVLQALADEADGLLSGAPHRSGDRAQRDNDDMNEGPPLSLDYLRELPVEEAKLRLTAFKGVGKKTAACVLMFNMGRPEFAVDTHVRRVAGRLRWVPDGTSADGVYDALNPALPDDVKRELHVLIIELGRTVCTARVAQCSQCPLVGECGTAAREVGKGGCGGEDAE